MAMALRGDFGADRVRAAARASTDAGQTRRLLALAAIYEGTSRTEAAAIGGVTLQIVRDWVRTVNAAGPAGLFTRTPPGAASKLTEAHRAALAAMIEAGPRPAVHGGVRWRLVDLCQRLWDEFRVAVSPQTLSREVRAMRLRKLSARPRYHAQAPGAIAACKKNFPARLAERALRLGLDPAGIEIWFGDG